MNKKLRLLILVVLASAVTVIAYAPVDARNYGSNSPARPVLMTGQLEVQFETDVDVDNLLKGSDQLSLNIPTLDQALEKCNVLEMAPMFPWRKGMDALTGTDDMSKFFILFLPEDTDILTVIDELQKNPYIRSVSPVWAMPLYIYSDDPGSQWAISKLQAPDAWDIETGSDTAIIAIADAGVLYTHPDLIDNIWVNPGEDIDGDGVVFDNLDINSSDDDGNGLADDLIGYDFFSGFSGVSAWPGEDAGSPDIDPTDFNGHGTHCAGISAMVTNNTSYGAGLAGGWGGGNGPYRGARIMCLRVGGSAVNPDPPYDERGYVNSINCAQAIDYAAKMGACVINCSWGSSSASGMYAALQRCNDSGVVVVHAAGNDDQYSVNGGYMDQLLIGGYEVAMSIASTDQFDHKSDFSNYGPYVDISAPGSGIYSTYSNHGTPTSDVLSGTSMSAPHVAGLVALIKSHMPEFTKYEIDTVIMNHADYIDGINPGYEGHLGSGRINAYASLATLPTAKFEAGPELVGPAPLEVNFTDLSPNSPISWEWVFGDGDTDALNQNTSHIYNDFGLFTVSLTVEEPRGTATEILKNLVMVTADTVGIDSASIEPSMDEQQVVLTARMNNKFNLREIFLPVRIYMNGNPVDDNYIWLDSISSVDCVTDYFEYVGISPYDGSNNRYGIRLVTNTTGGSEYLAPGEGPIIKFYLSIASMWLVPDGTEFTVDTTTLSSKPLKLESIYSTYYPEFYPGKIFVSSFMCGDTNGDGTVDILDILLLIKYKYKDGPPPDPMESGDVNLDGNIDVLDILYLIKYKYKDGPPPCEPE